jgi:hypothetical protein
MRDDLAPMRGILFGLVLAIAIWTFVIGTWVVLT